MPIRPLSRFNPIDYGAEDIQPITVKGSGLLTGLGTGGGGATTRSAESGQGTVGKTIKTIKDTAQKIKDLKDMYDKLSNMFSNSTGVLGEAGAQAAIDGSGGLFTPAGTPIAASDISGMTGSELGSAIASGAIESGISVGGGLGLTGANAAIAGSGGIYGAGGAALSAAELAGMTGTEVGGALASGALTSGAGAGAGAGGATAGGASAGSSAGAGAGAAGGAGGAALAGGALMLPAIAYAIVSSLEAGAKKNKVEESYDLLKNIAPIMYKSPESAAEFLEKSTQGGWSTPGGVWRGGVSYPDIALQALNMALFPGAQNPSGALYPWEGAESAALWETSKHHPATSYHDPKYNFDWGIWGGSPELYGAPPISYALNRETAFPALISFLRSEKRYPTQQEYGGLMATGATLNDRDYIEWLRRFQEPGGGGGMGSSGGQADSSGSF